MLEKMGDFFDARLDSYDRHMLEDIEGAAEFYPFTAKQLPMSRSACVLDLGCGTGLELEYYFGLNSTASVTGIDLAPGMLETLRGKLLGKDVSLIQGSYFDVPFGEKVYDAAVSVESLHHFTVAEKLPLYTKLHAAIKDNGYFILTDYFAGSDEEEIHFRSELRRIKADEGIMDDTLYHFDTPMTVAHEIEALLNAGFSSVNILSSWGATHTLKAYK